jgi:hypothetical protein
MNKLAMASIAILFGVVLTGLAGAQQDSGANSMCARMSDSMQKPAGMNQDGCLCCVTGAVYAAQNTPDGVVLTITAKDPAAVKKIQDNAQKLAAGKGACANPNEAACCPVCGTHMGKAKMDESAVQNGKTCCACCKSGCSQNPGKCAK